jgi:hypothetical protein
MIERYGHKWTDVAEPLMIDFLIVKNWGLVQGVKFSLQEAYQNAITTIWPKFDLHRWSLEVIYQVSQYPHAVIFGPASCAKTYTVSAVILVEFFAQCMYKGDYVSLLCTNVFDNLRQRAGGQILELHEAAQDRIQWLPGYRVAGKFTIHQTPPNDSSGVSRKVRRGIFGKAVRQGGEYSGLSNLAGTKARTVRLVVDESQFLTPEFARAMANLRANAEFRSVWCGNPLTRTDLLGHIAEPLDGWDSLDPVSTEIRRWQGKRFDAQCLQLPGLTSPNLNVEDEAKPPFPYLLKRSDIEGCKRDYGEDSLIYYSQALGRIPSDIDELLVFPRKLCEDNNAFDPKPTWIGESKRVAGLDVSYTGGGDRTACAILEFGRDRNDKPRIALVHLSVIPHREEEGKQSYETVADDYRIICNNFGVKPQNAGFDATFGPISTGMARRWSSLAVPVVFSGKPDEDYIPVTNDRRNPSDFLRNAATQLTWALRQVIEVGCFRGMTEQLFNDAYPRRFELTESAVQKGLIAVETKSNLRDRIGASPDLADAVCVALRVACMRGFRAVREDSATDTRRREENPADKRMRAYLDMARSKSFPSYSDNRPIGAERYIGRSRLRSNLVGDR